MGWLDKYADGGKVLLQPDSPKLPRGYKIPNREQSSELATSIGGKNGEPAYLIPSFKYGKPLSSPLEEYQKTKEILGGPFKTWQDADKWEQEVRHPYVEKGQKLPSPLKWWNMKNGGEIAADGEIIEDPQRKYEREYQLYLQQLRQQEAQKGADAVRKGTNQFAEDYVFPTAKAAASFSPIGPVIGLMDAYNAYQQGDNTGAIIGAGLEALPYGLKYGVKGVKAILPYAKEAVQNTYKINPWAFKPNPNAYYRGVGKEGIDDILESGIVRSKKQHAYPEPYFSRGVIGDKYAKGYFAELSNEPMKGVGSFQTGDLIQTPTNQITIQNPNLKLYKKNWLQGYKEIPKPITAQQSAKMKANRMLSQLDKFSPENKIEELTNNNLKNIEDNFIVRPASGHHTPKNLGTNLDGKAVLFEDAPLTSTQKTYIAPHEVDHFYNNNYDEAIDWLAPFNVSKLSRYLRGKSRIFKPGNYENRITQALEAEATPHGNEIRARAGQLKDFIADSKGIPRDLNFEVTSKDLNYALKNFVKKTGMDNSMTEMINALIDKSKFLENMNKYPLSVFPAAAIATQIPYTQKRNGGTIPLQNITNFSDGGEITKYNKDNIYKLRNDLKANYSLPLLPEQPYPNIELEESAFSPSQKAVGDWLKARAPQYQDQLGNGNLDRQLINLGSSKTATSRYDYAGEVARNDLRDIDKENDMDLWKSFYELKLNQMSLNNTGGEYMPRYHMQFAEQGPQFNRGTVQRHESTHAANAVPQENKIGKIIGEPVDKYLDNPSEVYSRLMQLRLDNKFDPNKKWTPEDIEYIRNLDEKKKYNLGRYSDEQLLKLLNDVALNSLSEGNKKRAKNGIVLPKQNITKFTPIKKQPAGWLDKY